ncbi:MAG: helix-turn-helix transcriptional regulator [Planctomycetota bacterium]
MDQRIGAWVRETRRAHGYSIKEVGAFLGVTYQQVQKYEKGANRLTVARLIAFTSALGISPNTLFLRLQNDHGAVVHSQDGYRAARIASQIEDERALKSWLAQGRKLKGPTS